MFGARLDREPRTAHPAAAVARPAPPREHPLPRSANAPPASSPRLMNVRRSLSVVNRSGMPLGYKDEAEVWEVSTLLICVRL